MIADVSTAVTFTCYSGREALPFSRVPSAGGSGAVATGAGGATGLAFFTAFLAGFLVAFLAGLVAFLAGGFAAFFAAFFTAFFAAFLGAFFAAFFAAFFLVAMFECPRVCVCLRKSHIILHRILRITNEELESIVISIHTCASTRACLLYDQSKTTWESPSPRSGSGNGSGNWKCSDGGSGTSMIALWNGCAQTRRVFSKRFFRFNNPDARRHSTLPKIRRTTPSLTVSTESPITPN